MNVAELVALLQTMPQDLRVAYRMFSERCLLEAADIEIRTACAPRPDGWIHNERPDKPAETYLVLPGN